MTIEDEGIHIPLFHRAHYNILAAQLRVRLDEYDDSVVDLSDIPMIAATRRAIRNELYQVAINMAKRFKRDRPSFDPVAWLDSCTSNPELYPMGELWEDEN